ncbi:MAG: T9SS type A sorting domain-containing protein, partial [Bacteroidales bacterium]|nr:T9SS type A sorting domain-containing protein [Bacteroidales bacterium]
ALAETLPDRYGLEGADLEEHGDYMRLLGLYRDLRRTGRTVGELTPEEQSMAEKIAGQGRGTSRAMAETLLERGFGGHNASFCPPDYATVLRDGTVGKGTGTDAIPRGLGASNGMTVTVSPSPATATATVAYTLPGKATRATLELANTLGVKVLGTELNGNNGTVTLDLGHLAGGVYYYTVRCGELVETGKLVVVK